MAQVYGGDEVNAIVLDTGSSWTRIGWAGDESPKYTISTHYAASHFPEEIDSGTETHRYYGDEAVHFARPNIDIQNPFSDGIITDWNAVQGLWQYAFNLDRASPSDSPVIFTDKAWNTVENRKKTLELALELFQIPATYIARAPVCSLFSTGRGSGLVVDAGAQTISVTPIVDGLVLLKPSLKSRMAGNYLNGKIKEYLARINEVVVPYFEIASKSQVDVGQPPCFTKKKLPEGITDSFRNFQICRILEDIKESMIQVRDIPLTEEGDFKEREFEFPTGRRIRMGRDRYVLGEELFWDSDPTKGTDLNHDANPIGRNNPTSEKPDTEMDSGGSQTDQISFNGICKSGDTSNTDVENLSSFLKSERIGLNEFSTKGVSQLIIDSINTCDVDIRANMANNIIITGGTSLVQGFTERINQDLAEAFPALKIRLYAPGNLVERTNSSWLGGSILSSIGTFHQLWVSKREYDEAGADHIVQKRLK